jgi:hypothetical protein
MRDDNKFFGMVWAGVFVIAKFLRISTIKHFVDGRDNIIRDRILMCG